MDARDVAGPFAGMPYFMADDFDEPLPDSFWIGEGMKLLVDTHAYIWWGVDPVKLSTRAAEALPGLTARST